MINENDNRRNPNTKYYKGLKIDISVWENSETPICCDNITLGDLFDLSINLYHNLEKEFGNIKVDKYIFCINNELTSTSGLTQNEFENIDSKRWEIEEKLFIEFSEDEDYDDEDWD